MVIITPFATKEKNVLGLLGNNRAAGIVFYVFVCGCTLTVAYKVYS